VVQEENFNGRPIRFLEESSLKQLDETLQGRSNWIHVKSSEVSIIGTHPSEITPKGYFTGQAGQAGQGENFITFYCMIR